MTGQVTRIFGINMSRDANSHPGLERGSQGALSYDLVIDTFFTMSSEPFELLYDQYASGGKIPVTSSMITTAARA